MFKSFLKQCLSALFASLVAISTAAASTPAARPDMHQSFTQMAIMFALFIGIFYFLLIRPQSKKQKQHRELVSSIKKGDEVVTAGGIVARVKACQEQYVVLLLNDQSEIVMQKGSVSSVLPKGTLADIVK